MMSKVFLLVVEGAVTEKNIFSRVLEYYGFNPINEKEKLIVKEEWDYQNYQINKTKDNVILIQGSQNRIKDILKDFDKSKDTFSKNFINQNINFAGIFLIYDCDHNSFDTLEKSLDTFNDELEGMLLLSCPCVEVLGEELFEEFKCLKFKKYKNELNKYHECKDRQNNIDYIVKNFNQLIIKFLKKNHEDFKTDNIIDDADKILEFHKINNEIDIGENKECIIRYFSTVVYIAIAYMLGLTKQINNYEIVLKYFEAK